MTAEVLTLAILRAFIIFVAEGLERFAEKEIDASPELRRDRDWSGTRPRGAGRARRRRSHPMTTITFDTLAYVKTLREAGVEEKQAEAQATALAAVLKSGVTDLSTKQDMELLRVELKKDLAETKAELIRWVVGVGILQTTLIVGIIARLAKVI